MSIRDQLAAAHAPSWRPEKKGDMLVGRVVGRSVGSSDYGEYPIVTFAPGLSTEGEATVNGSATFKVKTLDGDVDYDGSGPLAWHALGTIARREVDEKNPQPGDEGGVLFDGTTIIQSGQGKGKSARVHRLAVEKAAVAPAVIVASADAKPTADPAVVVEPQYDDGEPW